MHRCHLSAGLGCNLLLLVLALGIIDKRGKKNVNYENKDSVIDFFIRKELEIIGPEFSGSS